MNKATPTESPLLPALLAEDFAQAPQKKKIDAYTAVTLIDAQPEPFTAKQAMVPLSDHKLYHIDNLAFWNLQQMGNANPTDPQGMPLLIWDDKTKSHFELREGTNNGFGVKETGVTYLARLYHQCVCIARDVIRFGCVLTQETSLFHITYLNQLLSHEKFIAELRQTGVTKEQLDVLQAGVAFAHSNHNNLHPTARQYLIDSLQLDEYEVDIKSLLSSTTAIFYLPNENIREVTADLALDTLFAQSLEELGITVESSIRKGFKGYFAAIADLESKQIKVSVHLNWAVSALLRKHPGIGLEQIFNLMHKQLNALETPYAEYKFIYAGDFNMERVKETFDLKEITGINVHSGQPYRADHVITVSGIEVNELKANEDPEIARSFDEYTSKYLFNSEVVRSKLKINGQLTSLIPKGMQREYCSSSAEPMTPATQILLLSLNPVFITTLNLLYAAVVEQHSQDQAFTDHTLLDDAKITANIYANGTCDVQCHSTTGNQTLSFKIQVKSGKKESDPSSVYIVPEGFVQNMHTEKAHEKPKNNQQLHSK